jgi:hypothetical protein
MFLIFKEKFYQCTNLDARCKGAGTLLHMLHVCYSFHQKCSKLDTFTDQGPNILKTGIKFKKLVLNCPFRVPQKRRFLGDCSVRAP